MDLNVVTLNVPYPSDYGGMIDSFYRIKWLKHRGISIHLHCFQYGRQHSEELESVCETVKYYPRDTTLWNHFSTIPFIIKSRNSEQLLDNLKENDYPILFDGLHTSYFLNHPDLSGHKKYLRVHNIEHQYYKSLAINESNLIKKLYYTIESRKLKYYETRYFDTESILTISPSDNEYFSRQGQNVSYIAPFHPYEEILSLPGKGDFIVYHGDLSVRENALIVEALIKNVFSKVRYSCIIAGKNPPNSLINQVAGKANIKLISNPGSEEMHDLIRDAHINLLPVLTSNGFKMKLLMALYLGRHCLVNKTAANYFPDVSPFHVAESDKEMIDKINDLMNNEFTTEMIHARRKMLEGNFSNQNNSKNLIELIFR
jgi:hypothetical protein